MGEVDDFVLIDFEVRFFVVVEFFFFGMFVVFWEIRILSYYFCF